MPDHTESNDRGVRRRLGPVLVAAATTLAAGVAVVPVASAEEIVHHDFRHDVRWGEDDLAPKWRDPDILRVRVGHRERAVVVRVTFDKLQRPRAKRIWSINVPVKTPRPCTAGPLLCEYGVSVYRHRDGKITSSFDYGATESEVEECAGIAFKIAWRWDYFRVRIPRSCLGVMPRHVVRSGTAVDDA